MRLEPVRSLWIGKSLPEAQRACIASFLRVGHPFELFTYADIEGVPHGTRVRPAAEIVPEERVFTYGPAAGRGAGGLGGFSNLFRHAMLAREGGYWVDTDTFCLRPFPTDPVVISSERMRDGVVVPNCGVLKCPAQHSFARYCLARAEKADPETLVFGETGPALIAEAVRDLGLENAVMSADAICAVDWFEHETLCRPGMLPEAAVGLHLWSERWRRAGTSIPWPGPEGSVLHALAALNALEGDARAAATQRITALSPA